MEKYARTHKNVLRTNLKMRLIDLCLCLSDSPQAEQLFKKDYWNNILLYPNLKMKMIKEKRKREVEVTNSRKMFTGNGSRGSEPTGAKARELSIYGASVPIDLTR